MVLKLFQKFDKAAANECVPLWRIKFGDSIQEGTWERVCEIHVTRASHQYHALRKRDFLSNPRSFPVWQRAEFESITVIVLGVQVKTPDDGFIITKPGDHLFGSEIDTAHLLHLVVPLLDVGLVDAESVNPQPPGMV
jgi:hypothetical protein